MRRFLCGNSAPERAAGAGHSRASTAQPVEQARKKLVPCARGQVFDVVVDARRSTPTFGQ